MFDQNPNQPNLNNQAAVEDILAGVDDRPVLKEVIISDTTNILDSDATTSLATHKLIKVVVFCVIVPSVVLAGGFAAYKYIPKNEKKIINTVAPITDKIISSENEVASTAANQANNAITPSSEIKPNINVELIDTDNDGLNDNDERNYLTNPKAIDTDSDGLSDYEEIKKYQTDPLSADTDGDGFTDGSEITKGYNPKGSGKLIIAD